MIDAIDLEVNEKNSKFLVSAFYNAETIPEEFLKIYKTDLFTRTDQTDEEVDCINMILASDYINIICTYNLNIVNVFEAILKHDDNNRIVISSQFSDDHRLRTLWERNGKGLNDLNQKVSFVDEYIPKMADSDHTIFNIVFGHDYFTYDRTIQLFDTPETVCGIEDAFNYMRTYFLCSDDSVNCDDIKNRNLYLRAYMIYANLT